MAVGVTLTDVQKNFGALRALDRVTLPIEPGALFFLLGPSGCGKTTLLRCIAGFCIPDAGRVHIGDMDVTRRPPHERDAGMVFQSYALWPHMTVRENVAFGLEQRRVSRHEIRRRVEEALDLVHMRDRSDHRPNQLSGGQQQRVALARALVIQPRCLLLDEPLSNLDAKLRIEMRAEIRRICKTAGLTAVYVTHDQKEALSMADRLAVMNEGRVLQSGTPREVYREPAGRFVAHFIGEGNFLPATAESDAPGGTRYRTPLGPIVAAGKRRAPGASVTLCVRPEDLRLSPPTKDAVNRLDGHVHDTAYLGELAQHRFTPDETDGAPPAAPLQIFELAPRRVARDGERIRVSAWIEPDDVIVLTEEPR